MAEAGPSTRFRSMTLAVLAAGGALLPVALLGVAGFGLLSTESVAPTTDPAAGSGQAVTAAFGATGVLPQTAELDAAVLQKIASGDDVAAGLPDDALVIPPVALAAYQRAESALALQQPGCKVSWPLLAGLGRVLSDHGGGSLDPAGNSVGPIVGPALDGSFGLANVHDTDGGQIDGDTEWDRASGPLQIIPSVWRQIGADSDGDGFGSPHNVFDAALTAGRYVCADGADLGELPAQAHAVFRYQQSDVFVRAVMAWRQVYGDRLAAVEPPPLALPPVQDIRPPSATPLPVGSLPPGDPQPPASSLPPPAAPSPNGSTPADRAWPHWPMPSSTTGTTGQTTGLTTTRPTSTSTLPPTTQTTAPTGTHTSTGTTATTGATTGTTATTGSTTIYSGTTTPATATTVPTTR